MLQSTSLINSSLVKPNTFGIRSVGLVEWEVKKLRPCSSGKPAPYYAILQPKKLVHRRAIFESENVETLATVKNRKQPRHILHTVTRRQVFQVSASALPHPSKSQYFWFVLHTTKPKEKLCIIELLYISGLAAS